MGREEGLGEMTLPICFGSGSFMYIECEGCIWAPECDLEHREERYSPDRDSFEYEDNPMAGND